MTIELNQVYRNVKNSTITATVAEIDENRKTALLETSDGKTKSISWSTLKDKRQWESIDEEVAEVMQQKADLGIECPEINPEEVKIVSKNRDEEPVKKVRKPRAKKPQEGIGFDIYNYITSTVQELGGSVYVSTPTNKFSSFKITNKVFAAVFSYGSKSATLAIRGCDGDGSGFEPTSHMKHLLNYVYKFTSLTDDDKYEINQLILRSLDCQIARNKARKNK